MHVPRWLRIVGIVVVSSSLLVLGSLGALFAAQPTSFRIARVRTVPVSPDVLVPLITDVREVHGWFPQFADPHDPPTVTFSADTVGVGAWVERRDSTSWSHFELDAVTPSSARYTNENHGKFGTGHAVTEFTLKQVAASTDVELAVSGELTGMLRMLWPIANLESKIGPDLDKALAQLAARAGNAK